MTQVPAAAPRVGVVGLGPWGRNLVRVFAQAGDLVACANRGDPAARAWLGAAHPGVRLAASAEALIGDPEVDAVVIATPPATHAELAAAALRAGKHVFVEKPLATDAESAARLVGAARDAGLRLFVGHTFLYHPAFTAMARELAGDPVREVRFHWSKWGTFESALVWNLFPHPVSLALGLFGRAPDEVEVLAGGAGPTPRDYLSVRLGFAGGGTAVLTVDRAAPVRGLALTAVAGSRRVLAWHGEFLYDWRPGAGGAPAPVALPGGEPLLHQARAFLDSLAPGAHDPGADRLDAAIVAVLARIAGAHGAPRPAPPAGRAFSLGQEA